MKLELQMLELQMFGGFFFPTERSPGTLGNPRKSLLAVENSGLVRVRLVPAGL